MPVTELLTRNTTSGGDLGLQVICAWPVSGQYGPGSRILYYVLVAICVLARKSDWLRNACLAATLLLPMVAAVHGIVLAAVDVQDAVDMDIFGAFQLCAIGVLVAPVTAKLSRTYLNGPGHNAIILWSLFVVAGLVSLTVEFIRVANSTTECTQDDDGRPVYNDPDMFPYGNASCGLICSTEAGPTSRIRRGAGDNIYVVPAPHALTFNACILLAAACCIPAILLVASLLLRSFKINWNTRFVHRLKLKLSAFVFVFEAGTEAPTIDTIKDRVGPLSKLGIIRTSAVRQDQYAFSDDKSPVMEMRDPGPRDDAIDGFANLLDHLTSRSTLAKYEYEIWGSSLQVLEVRLAHDIMGDDIAIELRTTLQDLDQEGVDAIVVEGLPPDISDRVNWVMQQLRDDQNVREEGAATSKNASRAGSLFARYTMGLVFSASVIAILVVGERNFWSGPVYYQTEPMGNIGQWAPIAGTFLLMIGSIYVVVAGEMRKERRRQRKPDADEMNADGHFKRAIRQLTLLLIQLSNMLSPQRKRFDDSGWEQNAQKKYPTVPGEENRFAGLQEAITTYTKRRSSASSYRTNASASPSIRNSRDCSRERSASEIYPLTTRRTTLSLEPPEPVYRPRRSTTADRTSPLIEPVTSLDNEITLVVTSHDDHNR